MGLFVGIDLGTTQTAVAVGTIGSNGELHTRRLPLLQPVPEPPKRRIGFIPDDK